MEPINRYIVLISALLDATPEQSSSAARIRSVMIVTARRFYLAKHATIAVRMEDRQAWDWFLA
jgi:hypothetical protein